MTLKLRVTPNPQSQLLNLAVIGGAGLSLPPDTTVPEGMAAVLLFVPINCMIGKTIPEIQTDIGLPWFADGGESFWFDEQ